MAISQRAENMWYKTIMKVFMNNAHQPKSILMKLLGRYFPLKISALLVVMLLSGQLLAQPCLPGWDYRLPVLVNNAGSGSALTSYQAVVEVNTALLITNGKMQLDGRDIRFLGSTGNALPFWIENGTFNTPTTRIWVKVESVPANGSAFVYMFYGNQLAISVENPESTFDVFDDFGDVALDPAKWQTFGAGGVAIANGELTLSSAAVVGEQAVIKSVNSIESPVILEAKMVGGSNGQTFIGLVDNANNGYALNFEKNPADLFLMRKVTKPAVPFVLSDVSPANMDSENSVSYAGEWAFAWQNTNSQYFKIPSVARQQRAEIDVAMPASIFPIIGHSNQGLLGGGPLATGSVTIDWVRARKFSAVEPETSLGTEATVINSVTASSGGEVCAGSTLQLFAQALPGAVFSWTGPNGFNSTDQNPVINNAQVAATGTYTVTATVPANCFSAQDQVTVTVSPLSVGGTVSSAAIVCSGSNSGTLTLAGNTGTVVRWESSPSVTGPWFTINNATTSLAYQDLTASAYFRAVVKSGSCPEAISSHVLIDVRDISASSNGPLCQGSTLFLTAGDLPGATYSWSGPSFTSPVQNPNIPNMAAGEFTYTVTYTKVGGACNGKQVATTVNVSPTTVAGTVTGAVSVCAGKNSGTVQLAGHTGAIQRWESGVSAVGPWTPISSTSTSISYENIVEDRWFRAAVKSGECAELLTNAVKITAVSMEATATAEVCANGTIQLNVTSLPGATYSWSGPNTYSNNTQNPSIANATTAASGTYTVTINAGTACGALVRTVDVLVSPATNAGTLSGATEVCYGVNSGTLTLAGKVGDVVRWENAPTPAGPWTTINNSTTTLSYSNILESTYIRAWVKSGSCNEAASNTQLIEVSPTSVAGSLSADQEACAGTNAGTFTLSGHTGLVVKWQSSANAGGPWVDIVNATTSLTYNNLAATTFYRAEVKSGSCVSVFTQPAKVQVYTPTVAGLLTGAAAVCGDVNNGTLTLAGFNGSILKWEAAPTADGPWSTVDNTTNSLTYNNLTSTQHFRAVVQNGTCSILRSNIVAVTVDLPSVGGTILGSSVVCGASNEGVLRIVNFRGGVVGWESRLNSEATWSPVLGEFLDSLVVSNITDSTFYRAVIKNGVCPNAIAFAAVVRVAPNPVARFDADPVCETSETEFLNYSSISAGSIVAYTWDLGDGRSSILREPKHIYEQPGIYTASLTVTSNAGCITKTTRSVTVNAFPEINFSVNDVCQNIKQDFNPQIQVKQGTVGSVRWTMGDGNIINRGTNVNRLEYTYDTADTYQVNLRVISAAGCTTAITKPTVVYPRAELSFEAPSVFLGQTTNFFNNSTIAQGNLKYQWSFGDGDSSISVNPRHTYQRDTTFIVRLSSLSSFGGCRDTIYQEYVVKPQVVAGFTFDNVCMDYPMHFTNTTTIGFGQITYLWDFGDGTTSTVQNPVHKFTYPGRFRVRLTATSDKGSKDVAEHIVTVHSEPKAMFLAENQCDAESVTFTNLTSLFEGGMNYAWTFDDGTTSNVASPSHVFPTHGDYNVLLVATTPSGCIDSLYRKITIHPAPVPMFSVDTVCLQINSEFKNLSTVASGAIVRHTWDFGDGTNSIVANPVKAYSQPGVYQVKLQTETDKGCKREITKPAKVLAVPSVNFTVGDVCLGKPTNFVNRSTSTEGQMTYAWSLGDGGSSVITDPTHTYLLPKVYKVKLTATTSFGCVRSVEKSTEVFGLPNLIVSNDTTVHRGYPAKLSASGAQTYFWSPGIGLDNQSSATPTATLLATQQYTVLAVDRNGCEATDRVNVTVINDFLIVPSNVITPDDNGINDTWFVENIQSYDQAEVTVFNLWGQVVYQKKGYQNDWGGIFNNDPLTAGNYYYTITSPDHDKVYKGTITLLRAR